MIDLGKLNYTKIEGTLKLTNVSDLSPLSLLRQVNELEIANTSLKNLDDLQCVSKINSLKIIDNSLLESLKGLRFTDISQPNIYFKNDVIELYRMADVPGME